MRENLSLGRGDLIADYDVGARKDDTSGAAARIVLLSATTPA